MADIFVSYASEDLERVRPLVAALEDRGWSVWWDRQLVAGPRFDEKIEEAIDIARCVVVAWSRYSVLSDWVRDEASEGRERGILVPLLLDSIKPPLGYRSLQTADLTTWPKSRTVTEFANLCQGIEAILSADPYDKASPRNAETGSDKEYSALLCVLPLQCSSQQHEIRDIAETISDDMMINMHSSGSWRTVGGRESDYTLDPTEVGHIRDVSYLLTGALRKRGSILRVVLEIVETRNGNQVWSERFDRPWEGFYDIQDMMVAGMTGIIRDQLIYAEQTRLRDVPVDDLDANGLLCRVWQKQIFDRQSRDEILGLFHRILELDPDHVLAHAAMGITLQFIVNNNFTRNPVEDAQQAVFHADRALALKPTDLLVVEFGSGVHRCYGSETLALRLAERATAMKGYPSPAHYFALIQQNELNGALALSNDDPNPPEMQLAVIAIIQGRLSDALVYTESILGKIPNSYYHWINLANILALMGRTSEAMDAISRAKSIVPTWTLALHEEGLSRSWRHDDRIVNPLVNGLRKLESEPTN